MSSPKIYQVANLQSSLSDRVLKAGDTMTGNLNVAATLITQNVIPDANVTYDLGTSTARFKDLWLSNSTIYLGEASISAQGGNVSFGNAEIQLSNVSTKLNVTNDLFVSGNVGIGMESPAYKLDVERSGSGIVARMGTASNVKLHVYTDSGSAYLSSDPSLNNSVQLVNSSNLVLFNTNGSERARITSDGNIGIGTTNPTYKLQIVDTAPRVTLKGTENNNNVGYRLEAKDGDGNNRIAGVYLEPRTGTNQSFLGLSPDDVTSQLIVRADGYVGVGTTNPIAPLQVVGEGPGSAGTLNLRGANSHLGLANTSGTFRGWFGYFNTSNHGSEADLNIKTGYNGASNIRISADGDGTSAQLYVQGSTGRLGIGTTSPSRRLHIVAADDTRGILVEQTSTSSYAEVHLSSAREYRIGTGGTASDAAANSRFYVFDATAAAHRFTIDPSGTVGIGTSSPSSFAKLQVDDRKLLITSGSSNWAQLQIANPNDGESSIAIAAGGTGSPGNDSTYTRQWVIGINPYSIGVTNFAITNKTLQNSVPFKIDESGRVNMGQQPSFFAYGSGLSLTAGTWQTVSTGLTTTSYNIGSHYNTSNGRFTAPVAGRYCFYAGGYFPQEGNGARYAFAASVNGGPDDFLCGGDMCNTDSPLSSFTIIRNLNAGDYVLLRMFVANAVTLGAGAHPGFFGGYLLG